MTKLFFSFLCLTLLGINHISAYIQSPYVDSATWSAVSIYLLPENHPAKAKLDKIFSGKRVTLNTKSLENAGFETPEPREYTHTVVSKHPKLKGYVIKLFTDDYPINEVPELLNRIVGAQIAQETINRHGYQKMFVVPKKWLYPLPAEPSPPAGTYRKNFILIAENMKVYKGPENYSHWRSYLVDKELLNALYTLVQEKGLDDSVLPSNIPFTKEGNKVALIDTGVYHRWPIRFYLLTRFLSPTMKTYWQQLINQGGPK